MIAVCTKRKRWIFQAGRAHFLAGLGDPDRLPLLRSLAQTPGRDEHTPGNALALQGWVRIRAEHEGRGVADVAREALDDPAFDTAARRRLQRMVEAADRPGPRQIWRPPWRDVRARWRQARRSVD